MTWEQTGSLLSCWFLGIRSRAVLRVCLSLPGTLRQQRNPKHRLRGQIPSTLKFPLGSFLAAGGLGYFWLRSAGVFFLLLRSRAGMNKELGSLPPQGQPCRPGSTDTSCVPSPRSPAQG